MLLLSFFSLTLLLQPRSSWASLTAEQASAGHPVVADSALLSAELLVVEPGTSLYASLGHCALRLRSPLHKLDYCFTYEADGDGETLSGVARFFTASLKARWVAVPTAVCLADYASEHRHVAHYALPLTQDSIRLLWQRLDEAIASQPTDHFDFLTNNCTQGLLRMLGATVVEPRYVAQMDNGQLARHVTRRSPWMQYFVLLFIGIEADAHWPAVQRATPELLPCMLGLADGTAPVTADSATVLSVLTSPASLSALLVVLALAAFWLDSRRKGRRATLAFDVVLFSAQAAAFVLLVWLTQVSGLFVPRGGHAVWNWYFVQLAPLLPLLMLIHQLMPRRDRRESLQATRRMLGAYVSLLLLFMAVTPLSSQLDLSHQLVTAALAVRTYAYLRFHYTEHVPNDLTPHCL